MGFTKRVVEVRNQAVEVGQRARQSLPRHERRLRRVRHSGAHAHEPQRAAHDAELLHPRVFRAVGELLSQVLRKAARAVAEARREELIQERLAGRPQFAAVLVGAILLPQLGDRLALLARERHVVLHAAGALDCEQVVRELEAEHHELEQCDVVSRLCGRFSGIIGLRFRLGVRRHAESLEHRRRLLRRQLFLPQRGHQLAGEVGELHARHALERRRRDCIRLDERLRLGHRKPRAALDCKCAGAEARGEVVLEEVEGEQLRAARLRVAELLQLA